ncbi:MAG: ankyrin repeat domain-containing protein [Akkermansia sp.]|nr:ankyrin repeat domain-containing protein [Akkermansia sp.]
MATGNSQNTSAGVQQNKLALPEGVELGNYRILRSLGQGGFGITYLAEVISSGEKVVIKENLPTFCAWRDPATLQVSATNPNDELQEYPKLLTRFVEEAQLLARLDHPNIVKVQDAFEALGTAYYVMPWLDSKELHTAAPAPAAMTEAWLQPKLRTMLGALKYLHVNNIYHRDVKPANILLTEEGTPVLIDFGTARAIISERSATLVGSPGYSPIEQITVRGKRGPWTDIYSLGATCYRLITGERPLEANDRLIEETDPLRPLANRAELFSRFSPAFLATIDKALAIRGKDRWQSTDEWLTALSAAMPIAKTTAAKVIYTTPINTSTVSEPPEPPSSKQIIAPRKRGHKALITGAIIALVLALAIPGVYLFYQQAQEKAEQRMRDEFARQEAERMAREEAERMAREEAERKAREEAERKAREEAERKAREEAERKAREEAERKAREEAERKAREEAERKAREEAERKAREEAQSKLRKEGIPESQYDDKILDAASDNNPEQLTLLIAAGADVNKGDESERTPLLLAAERGYTECVRLLLAAPGIDVNKADKDGETPLYWAACYGRTECVKLLLAAPDIDINKADKDGETPLYWAAWHGHTECVQLLLAATGINVSEWNPLSLAIIADNTEQLRELLTAPDINVNQADNGGETPLYWAACYGRTESVKQLLAAPGIDVNKAAKDGDTPLCKAVSCGHTECVRLLLAAPDINVNQADKDSCTPLYWAAWYGRTECVQQLLAAPGIDVNKADEAGRTPLYWATYDGHIECVKLLLAAPGIDVNKAGNAGTPLYNAASEGHTECVQQLLAAPGIDINREDKEGYTPLIWAAFYGHTECVQQLLAAPGIDVNKAAGNGFTPLHGAAREGHAECVRLLLKAPRIAVNRTDKDGFTPFKIAKSNDQAECARLLRAAGGR